MKWTIDYENLHHNVAKQVITITILLFTILCLYCLQWKIKQRDKYTKMFQLTEQNCYIQERKSLPATCNLQMSL